MLYRINTELKRFEIVRKYEKYHSTNSKTNKHLKNLFTKMDALKKRVHQQFKRLGATECFVKYALWLTGFSIEIVKSLLDRYTILSPIQ